MGITSHPMVMLTSASTPIPIPTPTPTADTPERGFLRTAGGPRGRGPGARDGPALAVCAVEVLDCVAVPLHVSVSRRWRRVDAALPLLETAWWGLGCVCLWIVSKVRFWEGGEGGLVVVSVSVVDR